MKDTVAPAVEADSQSELELLRLLAQTPDVSQRSLAQEAGFSLGKSHYILQALLRKGWVKVPNFRRSDNQLSYVYLLTPSGIAHRTRLTRVFLASKEREFEHRESEVVRLRRKLDKRDDRAPTNR